MLGDQNDLPPAGSAGGRIILVRVGIAAAVLAALAILAGTAALAVSAASRPVRHSGHRGVARQRRPAGALRLLSVRPPSGARVSGDASVRIEFSAPLEPGTPLPRLSPRVTGRWQISGSTLTFTPDRPLPPSTRFRLRIPSGQSGLRSIGGGLLTRRVTTRFATAAYSQLRLAELLSSLGYLPLSWQPGAGGRLSGGPAGGESAQQELAYSPPVGSFSWQRGYPVALHGLWRPALASPLVRGAVMAFKAQHRLPITAVVGARLWRALFAAAESGQRNPDGYTYAVASKGSPETLTIWHDGRVVLHSLANTGIPVAPTASGTFPVYLRYRYQVMRGTNPDGSPYADPVSFVAYFDGGDAVHYFPRGSYGFEQSLGCVELPYSEAAQAWPYLTYGSLVTVAG